MSAEIITVISLGADATLTIFGAASVFVVLWQDHRRRSNQYFALCMALFTAYGASSVAWRVAQQAGLAPDTTLYTLSSFYVIGMILLFNFTLSFAGLPRRFRRTERLFSFPLMIGFLILMWSGNVYRDFEPLAGGSYHHSVLFAGQLFGVLGMVYILAILWAVYHFAPAQGHDFAVIMVSD
jgi:hypothetical protein